MAVQIIACADCIFPCCHITSAMHARKVCCAGHSLGGALATLAAYDLKCIADKHGLDVQVSYLSRMSKLLSVALARHFENLSDLYSYFARCQSRPHCVEAQWLARQAWLSAGCIAGQETVLSSALACCCEAPCIDSRRCTMWGFSVLLTRAGDLLHFWSASCGQPRLRRRL